MHTCAWSVLHPDPWGKQADPRPFADMLAPYCAKNIYLIRRADPLSINEKQNKGAALLLAYYDKCRKSENPIRGNPIPHTHRGRSFGGRAKLADGAILIVFRGGGRRWMEKGASLPLYRYCFWRALIVTPLPYFQLLMGLAYYACNSAAPLFFYF